MADYLKYELVVAVIELVCTVEELKSCNSRGMGAVDGGGL